MTFVKVYNESKAYLSARVGLSLKILFLIWLPKGSRTVK